jgi:hypothetical protein
VGRGRGDGTLVSHDLQRGQEMGCVKLSICVKRASEGAWDKGLEETGYAQGEHFLQVDGEAGKLRLERSEEIDSGFG